jgi:hypothetical protein
VPAALEYLVASVRQAARDVLAVGQTGADEATRYELVKLVLDHRADPNLPQAGGFRAIDAARQNGDERVERLLKERGAED